MSSVGGQTTGVNMTVLVIKKAQRSVHWDQVLGRRMELVLTLGSRQTSPFRTHHPRTSSLRSNGPDERSNWTFPMSSGTCGRHAGRRWGCKYSRLQDVLFSCRCRTLYNRLLTMVSGFHFLLPLPSTTSVFYGGIFRFFFVCLPCNHCLFH